MNYSKLILVGFISAFVAIATTLMGVTGTIIGSVISSVLYNMLSEALEKPVQERSFSSDFEWEIAYVFPLVVILFIQLLFIFALLSESGYLPYTFLNAYISLQGVAGNNLFRVLGIALIVMSVYPFVLKPDFIKKSHGVITAFIGIIFLARGFVDFGNFLTELYHPIFVYFDFPIAVIAFFLILYVIISILRSANEAEKEFKNNQNKNSKYEEYNKPRVIRKRRQNQSEINSGVVNKRDVTNSDSVHNSINNENSQKFSNSVSTTKNPNRVGKTTETKTKSNVEFGDKLKRNSGINKSSEKIDFESNDLLDEYKK